MNVLVMSLQDMFETETLTTSDDRTEKRAGNRVNGIHMSDKIRFLYNTNIDSEHYEENMKINLR